jgi:phosphate acyltransferase
VAEGTVKTLTGAIRDAIRAGAISSVGGLLIRRRLAGLRAQLEPERTGGAILLGLRKPVVVAHGSFGPEGIASAVAMARRAVDERMVERTAEALEAAGALRSAPAASVAPQ